jgi:hypothetical protein
MPSAGACALVGVVFVVGVAFVVAVVAVVVGSGAETCERGGNVEGPIFAIS